MRLGRRHHKNWLAAFRELNTNSEFIRQNTKWDKIRKKVQFKKAAVRVLSTVNLKIKINIFF